MKIRNIILVLSIFFTTTLSAQEYTKKELEYKPQNFEESLIQLNKIFSDSIKAEIRLMTEKDFSSTYHFSTGRSIRNYWLYNRYLFGLIVTESNLKKDLISKGIYTDDDMSSVILSSFYRLLMNQEIQLEQQIKYLQQWYIDKGNLPNGAF